MKKEGNEEFYGLITSALIYDDSSATDVYSDMKIGSNGTDAGFWIGGHKMGLVSGSSIQSIGLNNFYFLVTTVKK